MKMSSNQVFYVYLSSNLFISNVNVFTQTNSFSKHGTGLVVKYNIHMSKVNIYLLLQYIYYMRRQSK